MIKTIEALFDGTAFRPAEPVALAPNTRVRMTIETIQRPEEEVGSFLGTARTLNLDGPPDWSVNLHEYLYGGKTPDAG